MLLVLGKLDVNGDCMNGKVKTCEKVKNAYIFMQPNINPINHLTFCKALVIFQVKSWVSFIRKHLPITMMNEQKGIDNEDDS